MLVASLLFGLLGCRCMLSKIFHWEKKHPSPTLVNHELLFIFSIDKGELVLHSLTQSDTGAAYFWQILFPHSFLSCNKVNMSFILVESVPHPNVRIIWPWRNLAMQAYCKYLCVYVWKVLTFSLWEILQLLNYAYLPRKFYKFWE